MENLDGRYFFLIPHVDHPDFLENTTFKYIQFDELVTATFYSHNICYGELLGLVKMDGVLHVIFNYYTNDSKYYSGTCEFKEIIMEEEYFLIGSMIIVGDTKESKEIILKELKEP